jgi:hypothetical protein
MTQHLQTLGASIFLCGCVLFAMPLTSDALVFADESTEPTHEIPPDFPYWEHVTQRRYDGPTVIYLGGGWALTARHVGYGEIVLRGEFIPPERGARHTLLNSDLSIADAMVFELKHDFPRPDLPLLPIATEPPTEGEEVVMIGFGRTRNASIEWGPSKRRLEALSWSATGTKRWGTNRILEVDHKANQDGFRTWAFVTQFLRPGDESATPYEASATLGDSGGAVFVKRNDQWQLIGLITSVGGTIDKPRQSTAFGDLTYSADLSKYRQEIIRWTRAECSNEKDDDGDEKVDYPDDPECESDVDRNERPEIGGGRGIAIWWLGSVAVLLAGLAFARGRRNQRSSSTPDSTSSSSAR